MLGHTKIGFIYIYIYLYILRQTWQRKVTHISFIDVFPLKTSVYRGFPSEACLITRWFTSENLNSSNVGTSSIALYGKGDLEGLGTVHFHKGQSIAVWCFQVILGPILISNYINFDVS